MTDFIESNDIFGDATTILGLNEGDTLIGALNSSTDVDWLSVSLVAGQSYLMTQNGLNIPGGMSDPLVRLFDSNSVQVASDDDSGPGLDSVLTFTAPSTGTFFIQAGAFSNEIGAYELTFDTLHETADAPDTAMTPFSIAPGETFNGTFANEFPDDLDRVAVQMQAGETYFASLEGFGNTDPGLRLFGANGALLTQNDNFFGSNSSFISYTATTSGTYYLQALTQNGEGAYQLNLGTSLVEGPDAPQNVGTPYSIAAGETFMGVIDDAEDHDIVAAQVTAGETYLVVTQGINSSNNSQFMEVDVLDAASTGLTSSSDRIGHVEIDTFTATSTGTVFLDASVLFGTDTNYQMSMIMANGGSATAGNDILGGTAAADSVNLGAGNDFFAGLGGNDTIAGGIGDDVIRAGSGFDVIRAGSGNDNIFGDDNADNLLGEAGNDFLSGGNGFDRLFGGVGNDTMNGDGGSDGMFGQQGDDNMFGGDDNDRMNGGPGNDLVSGGAGNDQLFGGAGFDTIRGDAGDDTLAGNFNADQFVFTDGFGNDTITDFAATNVFERIDLFGVTQITDLTDLFSNHIAQVGANTVITADANNTITLQGVNINLLDATDFTF